MKKRILASLLALMLAMSFSACGKTDGEDSSSSGDMGALYTEEEQADIDAAKDVITKWMGYMNQANYTEARKLISADYAAQMGYNDAVDGESAGKYAFEFIDGGILLTTDSVGNIVVCVSINIMPYDDLENKSENVIYVTCFDTGALITSSGSGNALGGEQDGAVTDKSALANELAADAYSAANECIASLAEGSEMPEDGEYKESDDNEIARAVNDAIGSRTENNELHFTITVENGFAVSAEVMLSDIDSTIAAVYPVINEE